jgi:DNA-directed RNA polymerases I and III subunit RPAC2
MSVNEVKLKPAAVAFQVRGTGPPTSRTFAIGDEDHTIGNATRHILMQDARVNFAGYSVPHPSEPVVHIRVQTKADSGCTAVDALKDACKTLHSQCNEVMARLEDLLPEVKEDRLQSEKDKLRDASYFDQEEEEEEGEEEDAMEEVVEDPKDDGDGMDEE